LPKFFPVWGFSTLDVVFLDEVFSSKKNIFWQAKIYDWAAAPQYDAIGEKIK